MSTIDMCISPIDIHYFEARIINTLVKLHNAGLEEDTLKGVSYRLKRLAEQCNLENPDEVCRAIANVQGSNSYKETYVKAYNYYAQINALTWNKPRYKHERKIPKIPTTEAVEKIIARASRKYSIIFRLLSETGAMPNELYKTTLRDMDLEKGTITIQGLKGHSSRVFKLKANTQAMLSLYLQKYGNNNPLFPKPRNMYSAFMKVRNSLADKLKEPSLKSIRLYDLRHYYATMTYHKTKDILYTKQQLGHKRIETTLLYAQLVNFESDEYSSAVAKNIQEAQKLIESGFEYVTTFEGLMLFKKRK
jgi:integrase